MKKGGRKGVVMERAARRYYICSDQWEVENGNWKLIVRK